MKKIILFFIILVLLSSIVFGATGTSSDGSVTDKSSTGASAAAASSSDGSISSTISSGASAVASSYSGAGISGSPGAAVSTTTSTAAPASTSTSTTSSAASSGGGSIPSKGNPVLEQPAEVVEEPQEEPAEEITAAVTAEPEQQASLTVSKDLSAGESLSLSPSLVEDALATLFVREVTKNTATIQIMTQDNVGNLLTGNVVADVGEDVALTVGESLEVDADNDNTIDIEVTLTKITAGTDYVASFDITYYFADDITRSFVQKQIELGEVSLPKGKMSNMVWIIVGIIALVALIVIIASLNKKKLNKITPKQLNALKKKF